MFTAKQTAIIKSYRKIFASEKQILQGMGVNQRKDDQLTRDQKFDL